LTEVWLAVAYLVSMFVVLIFRPQRISDRDLFRRSYILFALYLILPAIADGIVSLINADRSDTLSRLPFSDKTPALSQMRIVATMAAQCLLAISIFLGLASLTHRAAASPAMPDEQ
jgi:uncharacterized membrane protein